MVNDGDALDGSFPPLVSVSRINSPCLHLTPGAPYVHISRHTEAGSMYSYLETRMRHGMEETPGTDHQHHGLADNHSSTDCLTCSPILPPFIQHEPHTHGVEGGNGRKPMLFHAKKIPLKEEPHITCRRPKSRHRRRRCSRKTRSEFLAKCLPGDTGVTATCLLHSHTQHSGHRSCDQVAHIIVHRQKEDSQSEQEIQGKKRTVIE